ncbi:TIGR03943 family putative permease subunit [Nocardia barduliensis]|uniref:TIGR03943 family putative permease subunit n=1 Tax=Nocardia barduliensis TaxID=2736643 RepID=UPI001571BF7C|nr:TIGR03943 family protein [Nocardia barduliensis]
MRRETQNLLLLLIGGAVLWTALDGSYLRYVKPSLHPFLVISGIGFILLGLVAIARDIGRGAATAADEHGHSHGSGRVHWLLLLPAAALLLIAPPPLGAEAALTSSRVQVVPRDSPDAGPRQRPFPPLPADGVPTLRLVDLVNRALLDSEHSLDGREVMISGFVMRPNDLGQHEPDTPAVDLARVVITCCVGDARYVQVHLAGLAEAIEDDAWLEVRGVVEPGSAQHDPDLVPTLRVTDYQRVAKPDHTYEQDR